MIWRGSYRIVAIAWHTTSGASLGGIAYAYDATGRIVERDISLGDPYSPTNPSQPSPMPLSSHKTYTYDDLDRLAMDGDVSYTYDAAGNRLSKIDPANGTTLYTLGSGDRLATYGRARTPAAPQSADGSYTYDTAGNVTHITRENGTTLDLAWNSQYQLVSVATNGVFAESYAYDALGRRVSTSTQEGIIRHIYDDNWQCIADVDENGSVVCSYVWGEGIDNLLAVKVGGNAYYPLTDIQGTVWGYADSANNIVARFDYDAWGNILSATSTVPTLATNRYRFQGREWSAATGLSNFRMRWYDAVTGRWFSKDPIGLSGGLNLYAFCGNDAVNLWDPYGKAYIGYRPLSAGGGKKQTITNAISGFNLPGNLDPRHAEIFFNDGKFPKNIGYSDKGIHPDNINSSPPYNDLDSTYYDDKIMRDAVDEVKKTGKWKGSDYNVISHNCQDFVSEVIRTYHLIKGR